MEQLARDKVAKYDKEQKLSERKVVLSEKIENCAAQEKKVC
jgi:hypothetical protein